MDIVTQAQRWLMAERKQGRTPHPAAMRLVIDLCAEVDRLRLERDHYRTLYEGLTAHL